MVTELESRCVLVCVPRSAMTKPLALLSGKIDDAETHIVREGNKLFHHSMNVYDTKRQGFDGPVHFVPSPRAYPTLPSQAAKAKGAGSAEQEPKKGVLEDRELANTCSRTMMSAKLLRLQTTEEAQAGFGAEQLKVVLNAFFKVIRVHPFAKRGEW